MYSLCIIRWNWNGLFSFTYMTCLRSVMYGEQATEGLGDPADGQVLGALIREVADHLKLQQPLLLAHSVGSQVGWTWGHEGKIDCKLTEMTEQHCIRCIDRKESYLTHDFTSYLVLLFIMSIRQC